MSSYIGRHAELYDIFYADKPYADEARYLCIAVFSDTAQQNHQSIA